MSPENVAQVRVIAASPDTGSVDFYAGGAATSNALRTAAEVFREIAERETTK